MTYSHKLARRLAILRAPAPHCAMLSALALIAACSAGTPTGVDTASNPADAPIAVNPRALILEANQVSVFKAYAKGVPGDSLVTSIEWTATGGTIGLDGTYSSPATGEYKIVGKRHGPSRTTTDTAKVVVVPPQPTVAQVIVSPSSATVTGKTQQTFVATGKLSDGSTVAIGVSWTATGGSIDAGGVFTAGSTAGSFKIIAKAASANVADTVPITVTAPPVSPPVTSGGSGQYPNRPGGMTQLFQYDGKGASPGCPKTSTNMTLGISCGQTMNGGSISFPSPSDAPFGGTVLDIVYPTGLKGGNEPYDQWMWNNGNHDQMGEYYEAGWFRIGANASATDFQGPGSGEWKLLGYWAVGATPGGYSAQIYNVASSSGTSGTWNLSIRAQGATSWSSGGGSVLCGKWYRYEIHMVLNDPDVPNGVLEFWLTNVSDGGAPVKVISKTDRLYRTSGSPAGFWQRSFVPVWGGGGGVKDRNDHLQIARMAGFGAPL
jgi:hypothetical protein